jgi:hypothetical protein
VRHPQTVRTLTQPQQQIAHTKVGRCPGPLYVDQQPIRLASRRASSTPYVLGRHLHLPTSCAVRLSMTCCAKASICYLPVCHLAERSPDHLDSLCVYVLQSAIQRNGLVHSLYPSQWPR